MQLGKLTQAPLARCLAPTLVVALVCIAGCGRNRVTANVDVDSFIDPDDLTGQYDAPPFPGLRLDLAPVSIDLVDGLSGVGPAEELELTVEVQYDNVAGEGVAAFTLYFAESADEVFSTPSVGTIDADLLPQTTTTGEARIAADRRILDLFHSERLFMGLRFEWTPATLAPLQGGYTITSINARVVSTVNIF